MTIKDYLEKVFANVNLNSNQENLFEEVLSGAMDEYDDLISKGITIEEANSIVIKNLGTVEDLRRELGIKVISLSDRNRIGFYALKAQLFLQLFFILLGMYGYIYFFTIVKVITHWYSPLVDILGIAFLYGFVFLIQLVIGLILLFRAFKLMGIKNEFKRMQKYILISAIISFPCSLFSILARILINDENAEFSSIRTHVFKSKKQAAETKLLLVIFLISIILIFTSFGVLATESYVSDEYYIVDYQYNNEEIEVYGSIKMYNISSNTPMQAELVTNFNMRLLTTKEYDEIMIKINGDDTCSIDGWVRKEGEMTAGITCHQGIKKDYDITSLDLILYEGSKPFYDSEQIFSIDDFQVNKEKVVIKGRRFIWE